MQELHSKIDTSVNFVVPAGDGGFYDSRFVQREPDYFIVYLSSHSGCNQTCRFCHLTATGQTMMKQATLDDFIKQASLVLKHYDSNINQPAVTVHFNFMSRGEPLLNDVVVNNTCELFSSLSDLAAQLGLVSKFKISTIMPEGFDGNKLSSIFQDPRAMLYYSLYSVDPIFRKKWLPHAMLPDKALFFINVLQTTNNRDVAIHGAFIKDQNDSDINAFEMVSLLNSYRIKFKFNIVRYNPYDSRYGIEATEERINRIFEIVVGCKVFAKSPNRIVPRVGEDVKASCGMFVDCLDEIV